jgi:SAM-dependent methyltransferase
MTSFAESLLRRTRHRRSVRRVLEVFPPLRRALKRWMRARLPPRYSEQELLARMEEFNRAAELYWAEVAAEPAGRGHALSKPFTSVKDAAGILYRFGLVLHELKVGPGHTVLDVGAGSCWLSAFLNRLSIRTVSVDVSPTALDLGRELFRLDPRQHLELDPQFIPYDGHRFPLEAESMDRIVCFDALHHVPNQDEVLAEIFRVLKPGGRVVLAEPGEGHSHAAQSVFEAERGVLENDLDLRDLARRAKNLGFDRVYVKPYPEPGTLTLGEVDYFRFQDGRNSVFPLDDLRESLREFYLFVLTKGELAVDSRNPSRLTAALAVHETYQRLTGCPRARRRLPVSVTNIGDTLWLHKANEVGGFVRLGAHLRGEGGVQRGYAYASLPRDIKPGDTVDLTLDLRLPGQAGCYVMQLDMVDEGLTWFELQGSPTVAVELIVEGYPNSAAPGVLAAQVTRPEADPPLVACPGATTDLVLSVENGGDTLWLAAGDEGRVVIGGHLLDEHGTLIDRDLFHARLPGDLPPGAVATLSALFRAPLRAGRYVVRVDPLIEGLNWFEDLGSEPLDVMLEVQGEPQVSDSRAPGILAARLEPTRAFGEVAAGATVALGVRLTNAGDTAWLHEPQPGGGQVRLGGHLWGGDGRLLDNDFMRASLPRSIPPGDTLEMSCTFDAPSVPGRYRLELDMVDEGIAWFAGRGSASLDVDLLVR